MSKVNYKLVRLIGPNELAKLAEVELDEPTRTYQIGQNDRIE